MNMKKSESINQFKCFNSYYCTEIEIIKLRTEIAEIRRKNIICSEEEPILEEI
jgi:hypothetical protein